MKRITVTQYKNALIGVAKTITTRYKRLLQIQYNLPDYKATASQLAEILGIERWTVINSWYGRLGHILSDELEVLPLKHTKTGKYEWWRIIAEGQPTQEGFVWTLKPEFIQALEELQIVYQEPFSKKCAFTQNCENILSELNYESDRRQPPDNLRRGQFKAGWDDAITRGRVYGENTLKHLTWHNLGYRLALRYGANHLRK